MLSKQVNIAKERSTKAVLQKEKEKPKLAKTPYTH